MSKYKAPEHLEDMGARYEHVERTESLVELRHSTEHVIRNYEAVALAFPVSGDNLALMKNGEPRWPKPVKRKDETDG